jgi:hypothetical protein
MTVDEAQDKQVTIVTVIGPGDASKVYELAQRCSVGEVMSSIKTLHPNWTEVIIRIKRR